VAIETRPRGPDMGSALFVFVAGFAILAAFAARRFFS